MSYITVNDQYTKSFIKQDKLAQINEGINRAHEQIHKKTGSGNEFLGWLDYPSTLDQVEFEKIKRVAEDIQEHSDILVVIGVGGSYLGARATIELLSHTFHNELSPEKRPFPKIIFAGYHLSGTYMKDLFDLLENKRFSINVISKSGSTLETAIAFRLLKQYMETQYDKAEFKKRIFITTDKVNGPLKKIATEEEYTTFSIPDDIGGRYSVLTAVGLLPIAVSGISIDELIAGAKLSQKETNLNNTIDNSSYRYAALRNALYASGKQIELFNAYEPRWHYFQEWWKQLYGESEGKNKQGIFPATANFTTDLHSIGQYIQDGERHLFQTILFAEHVTKDVSIPEVANDTDRLNYLANKTMHDINKNAFEGALSAHKSGGVPNIVIKVPEVSAFAIGYLLYFFQKACAISGYIQNVNPFDQPGVEAYKQNMMALLKSE